MPGLLRRRGSTSASSISVASSSRSTSMSEAGALSATTSQPSTAPAAAATATLAVSKSPGSPSSSSRVRRKAAEAAWSQQVGQMRSASRPNANTTAPPKSPTSQGIKPNLVASVLMKQAAKPFKQPYQPLPSSSSSPTNQKQQQLTKPKGKPRLPPHAKKGKGKAPSSDLLVVPAAAQVIDHTRATQRIMRSISGLGMEDPVGRIEDEDGDDDVGNSVDVSIDLRKLYYSPTNRPQHPSIIYEDMSLGMVPRDMRDLVSVASDPTANTKKGLDWTVWNDSLKNFDPEAFSKVPPVPFFVSKQTKNKKKGMPQPPPPHAQPHPPEAPATTVSGVVVGEQRTSPQSPTLPSSPSQSSQISPSSAYLKSSAAPAQTKHSSKRRKKKRKSLGALIDDEKAQEATSTAQRTLGKSVLSLESLSLTDVFPGTSFRTSTAEQASPKASNPQSLHGRRRSSNPNNHQAGETLLTKTIIPAKDAQASHGPEGHHESSSARFSAAHSSSYSASSSSNLLLAEAALALQLESNQNAHLARPSKASTNDDQLIASALVAAAVGATTTQLQRAGSVPNLALRPATTNDASTSSHRNDRHRAELLLRQLAPLPDLDPPDLVQEEEYEVPFANLCLDGNRNRLDSDIIDDEEDDDDLSESQIEQLGKTSVHSCTYSTQSELTDLILLGNDDEEEDEGGYRELQYESPGRDCYDDDDGETVQVVIMLVDDENNGDSYQDEDEPEFDAVVDRDGGITYRGGWGARDGSSPSEGQMSLALDYLVQEQVMGSTASAKEVLQEAITQLVREISQSQLNTSQGSLDRRVTTSGSENAPSSPTLSPARESLHRGSATAGLIRRGSASSGFQYPVSPIQELVKSISCKSPVSSPRDDRGNSSTQRRKSATGSFQYPATPTQDDVALQKKESSQSQSVSRLRPLSISEAAQNYGHNEVTNTGARLDITKHMDSRRPSLGHVASYEPPSDQNAGASSMTGPAMLRVDHRNRRGTSSSTLRSTQSSWRSSLWVIGAEDDRTNNKKSSKGAHKDRHNHPHGEDDDNDDRELQLLVHQKRSLPVSMASIFPED